VRIALTKVSVEGETASAVMLPPAIVFAMSDALLPSSSLMFAAACAGVCEPGLPDTADAAPRAASVAHGAGRWMTGVRAASSERVAVRRKADWPRVRARTFIVVVVVGGGGGGWSS
jgi:hypothetical protein